MDMVTYRLVSKAKDQLMNSINLRVVTAHNHRNQTAIIASSATAHPVKL